MFCFIAFVMCTESVKTESILLQLNPYFQSLDVIRDAVAKFTPPEGPKGPATKITQAMRK